jgi:hypothetical protein
LGARARDWLEVAQARRPLLPGNPNEVKPTYKEKMRRRRRLEIRRVRLQYLGKVAMQRTLALSSYSRRKTLA